MIDRVFAVMALAPQHTFQVLTKRAERMLAYLTNVTDERQEDAMDSLSVTDAQAHELVKVARAMPLPNVWLGVSAEDQTRADERIPHLLATPAAVRRVSAEPLLGPIDFRVLQPNDPPVEIDALNGTHGVLRPHGGKNARLDWIVAGGESGDGAWPMHPDWVRSIRDQCAAAGVAFHFKQWGSGRRYVRSTPTRWTSSSTIRCSRGTDQKAGAAARFASASFTRTPLVLTWTSGRARLREPVPGRTPWAQATC